MDRGDTILVEIDSSFSISYESSHRDSKSVTLTFTGGEFGELFSFLPDVSARSDGNISGSEDYEFQTTIAATIQDANPGAW